MYNPKREGEILSFWKENKIFEKTLEKTKDGKPYVFYDGPPFATGLPHYGHTLPTTLKDIMPRYQTMQGRHVPRVWGWDCHGLPIENLVEKDLGLKNKKDIEDYGVGKFNIQARNRVLNFADEWKEIIPRLGRWVDMENDYRTMDPTYTESVWWSFKTLHEKSLAYEGFKSMHLCPHCETVLSNFEVGQGYKDITDISVYAKFKLENGDSMLVWTTTPWTLPGNVALAVNSEITYVKIKTAGGNYILAKDRLEALQKILDQYEMIEEINAKDMVGQSYQPIFDYYSSQSDLKNKENGWKIVSADFVTTTEGTGIVHIAPAFGEDDLNLGVKENLPFVQHVGTDGKFKDKVRDFAGLAVKPKSDDAAGHQKTDIEIIKYLAHNDFLFAKEKIVHSYPHCWRCGTPLLNYATSSWFIKVSQYRDKMVSENQKIHWTPSHIGEGRFGKWLENARDWAISRSRYWGAPLPIWKSEDGKEIEVIGSVSDLKQKLKRNNYIALRHGEANHNVLRIMNSSDDEPSNLTENGKEILRKTAEELKKINIDIIFASPLARTRETAELVKGLLGVKEEIVFDERLKEENFGEMEGRSIDDYVEFYREHEGKETRLSLPVPGGECIYDTRRRITGFLYEVDKKYTGKNILLVTHDGMVKMIEVVSNGGTMRELLKTWNGFYFCVAPGHYKNIDFSQLPQNELYELDLHRPYIDEITWKSESGQIMRRITDVFDTWYDSGSMPFASRHYPFENKKEFEDGEFFPADFISEGTDQTRGWFYSLLALGVGLFERSPYNNVVVNGLILAEDGRKMSKSLNNYPPLIPTVEKYGADSLRYFLTASPVVKAEEVAFSEKALDEVVKKHFNRLYNIISLYDMYKENMSNEGSYALSEHPLDVWVTARLDEVRNAITMHLDNYEFDKAVKQIGDYIDDLSTWYIRRSRDRFKNSENELDRDRALSTTRHALMEFSKLMAPFIPFLAEDVFLHFRKETDAESVHLCDWPGQKDQSDDKNKRDDLILAQMIEVRKIVSVGLELRSKAGIKVRQPLSRLLLREDQAGIADNASILSIIKDEVNIKEIILDASIQEPAILDTEITEELRKEGIMRDVIRLIQDARKEKNLSPGEMIEVVIEGKPEVFHIVSEYRENIKKIASVSDFIFEEKDVVEFSVRIV
jgi:isoleucyl-tRNA synthetase